MKRRQTHKKILYLTLCLLFYGVCVSQVVAQHTVNIVTTNWPPFYSEEILNGGPLTQVSAEAFKSVGYGVKIEFLPWKRALVYVKTGEADALLGAYKNEERKTFAYYTESILGEARSAIIARKGSSITYYSLEKLKPYVIGILMGTSISKKFDSAKGNLGIT